MSLFFGLANWLIFTGTKMQAKYKPTCLKHTSRKGYSSRHEVQLSLLDHLFSSFHSTNWAKNFVDWFSLAMWKWCVLRLKCIFCAGFYLAWMKYTIEQNINSTIYYNITKYVNNVQMLLCLSVWFQTVAYVNGFLPITRYTGLCVVNLVPSPTRFFTLEPKKITWIACYISE